MRKWSEKSVKMERHKPESPLDAYGELLTGVVRVIEQARIAAARSVWPNPQTVSAESVSASISQTLSAESGRSGQSVAMMLAVRAPQS